MNSGDVLKVALHDTANGFQVDISDLSTGQSGSMTASAANGFGEVQYAPNAVHRLQQHPDQLPPGVLDLKREHPRAVGGSLL